MFNPSDWHQRFQQQAGWTSQIRDHIFNLTSIDQSGRFLEVGCGTGAVLSSLPPEIQANSLGLDINLNYLRVAHSHTSARLIHGNAFHLPFPGGRFQVVFCHYFLMWVDPLPVLAEFARVASPGGLIVAFAEPDYGGKIDYPPELVEIGQKQIQAIRRQGADPETGRKLAHYFKLTGLVDVHTGILGGAWSHSSQALDQNQEWRVLASDLHGNLENGELEEYIQQDRMAWENGIRVQFVPTFYAYGWVSAK